MNGGVLFKWRLFSPATFINTHSLARWNWPVCASIMSRHWKCFDESSFSHQKLKQLQCNIHTRISQLFILQNTCFQVVQYRNLHFFFLLSSRHIWAWAFHFFHFYWMLPCQSVLLHRSWITVAGAHGLLQVYIKGFFKPSTDQVENSNSWIQTKESSVPLPFLLSVDLYPTHLPPLPVIVLSFI